MILQALVKYYEMMAAEDKLPKQGYCTGKVSYALELSGEGELCGITTLRLPVEHGKKKGRCSTIAGGSGARVPLRQYPPLLPV